jgi:hypothetical protein
MGAVFRASHLHIGSTVAIKIMHPHMLEDPEFLERFAREARAAGMLNDAGVVRILDYDVAPDVGPFLVMDYLFGVPLSKRLDKKKRLPATETVSIGSNLLGTLEKIHELGIIHRDLKPANVFFSQESGGMEVLKILDFGIAQMARANRRTALTAPGTSLGTPRYMAPEQAYDARLADSRADIYGVGAILYRCISGVPPYHGRRGEELLLGMLTGPPRPLSEFLDDAPRELLAVIDMAMSFSAENRYATARDMRRALEDSLAAKESARATEVRPPIGDGGFETATVLEKARPANPEPATWSANPEPATRSAMPDATTVVQPRQVRGRPRLRWMLALLLPFVVVIGVAGIIGLGLLHFSLRTKESRAEAPVPHVAIQSAPSRQFLTLDPAIEATLEKAEEDLRSGRLEDARRGFQKILGMPYPRQFTEEGSAYARALRGMGNIEVAGYPRIPGDRGSQAFRRELAAAVSKAQQHYLRGVLVGDIGDWQCANAHLGKSYETAAALLPKSGADSIREARKYRELARHEYDKAQKEKVPRNAPCQGEGEAGLKRLGVDTATTNR